MDPAEIKSNIQSRIAAEQCFQRCIDESVGAEKPERFWERLFELIGVYVQRKPEARDRMNDEEAKIFENRVMTFGSFRGKRIADIPLARLEWHADQRFTDELRRYLASDRVQIERKRDEATTDDYPSLFEDAEF